VKSRGSARVSILTGMAEISGIQPNGGLLTVFLRDQRDYVQGTQIIARLAEQAAPEGSQLTQARFGQITANQVRWRPAGELDSAARIGEVQFTRGGQELMFHIEDTGLIAPRRLDTHMGVRVTPTRTDAPLSGQYRIEHPMDLEGLLNALIQSVKNLHERLGPGIHDVWFTGMRQCALPVQHQLGLFEGHVDIRHRRMIRRGPSHQSLVEVVVSNLQGRSCHRCMINFAFKSEHPIHVD